MHGYRPSTYGDAFADVYDDWYGEVSDVAATTAALVGLAGDGAVLELGVGSGRLAVPLAERGVAVWGLDASAAMLELLAARPGGNRVRCVLGDMAAPVAALGPDAPAFAVVACAFNTLFLLPDRASQATCIAGAAALLAPGGTLAVEAVVPVEDADGMESVVTPRTIELDRVVLTVTRHDPAAQVVVGQHVEMTEAGNRLRPWVVRYLHPPQLDELAAAAGLTLHERWSDWAGTPFGDDDAAHVSLYRRA